MSGISEEALVAYADGELDEVNRRRVERALAEDAGLAARLAAHRRLAAAVAGAFAPLAAEPAPERFRMLLESAATVTPIGRPRRRYWTPAAIAASLALGLLVGRGIEGPAGPVGMRGGQLVAQGDLARALDTQLASAQAADAATRIGLSFRARGGDWCRSFEGRDISGVACRADTGWRLEQAVPGHGLSGQGLLGHALPEQGAPSAYRQAASGDTRLLATVQALMADAPVDAAAEKAARDAGWTR